MCGDRVQRRDDDGTWGVMQGREGPCPSILVSRPLDQAGIAGQPSSIQPAQELTVVPAVGSTVSPKNHISPRTSEYAFLGNGVLYSGQRVRHD